MEDPLAADKQRQLQRVLNRVQRLPVLPGAARQYEFGHGHVVAVAEHDGSEDRPAHRPWLIALVPATSAALAAVAAAVTTLYVLQRETGPRRVRPGFEQIKAEPRPAAALQNRTVHTRPREERKAAARPLPESLPAEAIMPAPESRQVAGRRPDRSLVPQAANVSLRPHVGRDSEHETAPPILKEPAMKQSNTGRLTTSNGRRRARTASARRKAKTKTGIAAAVPEEASRNQPPRTLRASDVLAGGL